MKLSEGWIFLKVKISDVVSSSLNVAETMYYEVGLMPPATFVVSFANLKSHMLSCDPLGDRVMPRTEVRIRAQASHGNITVLSHLKRHISHALNLIAKLGAL